LVPIAGNAAEHASAIVFAAKNRLDISLGVAVGSSIQIALFVTPFCVLVGWGMGQALDLNFAVRPPPQGRTQRVVGQHLRAACVLGDCASRSDDIHRLPPPRPPHAARLQVFETVTVFLTVLISVIVNMEGRSNWIQGLLLVMAYFVVGAAFLLHNPNANNPVA